MTVDPHLHRYSDLGLVYDIPHRVVSAAPSLASWIGDHVQQPVLIGPDRESEQWVAAVASGANAPFVILDKVRRGDRDVVVTGPALERWSGHTPVLLDDLVSTGRTLVKAASLVRAAGLDGAVCVAVHGLFVGDALQQLRDAGIRQVVTTNTVSHSTNTIDISPAVAAAVTSLLMEGGKKADRISA